MNKIFTGDCIEIMNTLEPGSVNCCVTSPPYWGLRDYGHGDQIGLEESPEDYVVKMVDVFRAVRRVLRDDGTLWLNLGDSYWGGKGKSGSGNPEEQAERANVSLNKPYHQIAGNGLTRPQDGKHDTIKQKDLVGIPWRVAFAMQADGWYLRQDIIWHKPNPMPESVTDRCTKAHEYIFLLSKSKKYYYNNDAIKEPARPDKSIRNRDATKLNNCPGRTKMAGLKENRYTTRNKRSVWTVTTKPYRGAHFAVFPEALITPCILAGCPIGGVVLDPFMGSGTTALVAANNGRKYIGCELNPEYVAIAERRLKSELGFFYQPCKDIETCK